MAGWIKLHRKLQNHWLWNARPYSPGQAWMDLIMLAKYEVGKSSFRGTLYKLLPGQLITSDQTLANRWGWSRKKARNFLQLLEKDEMLNSRRDNRKTIVTICKWSDYQSDLKNEGTTEEASEGTQKDIEKGQQEVQQNHNDDKGLNDIEVQQKGTDKEQQELHNDKEEKKLIKDIVEYLNLKTGKNFKHKTEATQKPIRARLNDEFTLKDFQKVIDNKCMQWLNTENDKYLRPATLFGSKFEGYLNEKQINGKIQKSEIYNMGESK